MTRRRAGGSPESAADDRWGELADLVLVIARELHVRPYSDERAQHLSQSEGMVMRYLHQQRDAAPGRVATATGLQRPNLSAVLRSLEQKGLIDRRTDPDDGRGVVLNLTERGRTNYAAARHEWATAVSHAAEQDPADLDAALALLTSVRDGLVAGRR